jgi:hypothetical protein
MRQLRASGLAAVAGDNAATATATDTDNRRPPTATAAAAAFSFGEQEEGEALDGDMRTLMHQLRASGLAAVAGATATAHATTATTAFSHGMQEEGKQAGGKGAMDALDAEDMALEGDVRILMRQLRVGGLAAVASDNATAIATATTTAIAFSSGEREEGKQSMDGLDAEDVEVEVLSVDTGKGMDPGLLVDIKSLMGQLQSGGMDSQGMGVDSQGTGVNSQGTEPAAAASLSTMFSPLDFLLPEGFEVMEVRALCYACCVACVAHAL